MGYFWKQAWQNLNQNRWMNAVTLATITLSFIVVGIFLIIFLNTQELLKEWQSRMRITAYLSDSLSTKEIKKLKDDLLGLTEVEEVTYRSKEEALQSLAEKLKDKQNLLQGLPRNPLPASLEIRLKPAYQHSAGVHQLVTKLRNFSQITELQYGVQWIEKLSAFLILFQVLSWSLGGLLAITTIFTISNTMRLKIFARRDEIAIMRSVGATGLFIRAPFYLEGLLQGLFGASLAMLILFLIFRTFLKTIYEPLQSLLGHFPLFFLNGEQIGAVVLAGLILGFLGTQVSVGRFLRVY
ncbi:MAG: permease-like cell division protein FtsX [Thermodesulfobacteriota bacterium]